MYSVIVYGNINQCSVYNIYINYVNKAFFIIIKNANEYRIYMLI